MSTKIYFVMIVLCWGDPVRVRQEGDTYIALLSGGGEDGRQWSEVKLPKGVRLAPTGLLQLRFVDVGQGDGAILTSPSGKTVIVDGGQEEHMRHYVCVAYREEIEAGGLSCEAIVVTHGDSDHMSGLTEMLRGAPNHAGERRAVLRPARVFHNGLVNRPSRVSEAARLGPTERVGEVTYAVELTDDVRVAPADGELNDPFQQWRAALTAAHRADGAAPEVVRLARGYDRKLDFLADDGVHVEVLGPIVESLPSGAPGLRLYGDPRSSKPSASQTINGHWFISIYKDTNTPVDIFCGNGNNRGDGVAIARLLRDRFYVVSVHVLKFAKHDSLDFEINLKRVKLQSEIKLHFINEVIPQVPESSIIIDSLMGIGINKPVNGELKDLIKAINQLPNKKISVDIPSGLPSEGSAIGETICPNFIYTFLLPKISFFMQDNYAYCPSWVVGDIHLNPIFLSNVVTNCYVMDHNLIRSLYKIRQKFQHKGSFGHAMIIAGSKGKIGAAILATKACLRSGGGLVTVCIPEIGVEIIHETIPEAMVLSTGFQCLNSCPEHLDDYTLSVPPQVPPTVTL